MKTIRSLSIIYEFVALAICISLMTLPGCSKNRISGISDEDGVVEIPMNDPDFLLAQKEAQASWSRLIDYLDWDNCFLCTCMAKRAFEDNDAIEHMWVGQLEFRNDTLWGVLVNDPVEIHNTKNGDSTFVSKEMLEDWVCIGENEIALGNFLEEKRGDTK